MEKKEVKATVTIDGKTYEIMISSERPEQIKRLQKITRKEQLKRN